MRENWQTLENSWKKTIFNENPVYDDYDILFPEFINVLLEMLQIMLGPIPLLQSEDWSITGAHKGLSLRVEFS